MFDGSPHLTDVVFLTNVRLIIGRIFQLLFPWIKVDFMSYLSQRNVGHMRYDKKDTLFVYLRYIDILYKYSHYNVEISNNTIYIILMSDCSALSY
ncbi:hypothetical protein H5410_055911 [Solanum commersonii]|uniref:Uncharacterized protein n=1 Tax=Solanum commersonii TaxID=4109 RepID=A0A9J5WIV2_SOLCO|nr:hypothetical protein H5410_055911 [Solanum commersonii]